jgi:cbb3-type cytochrome oxidase subunit 1
MHEIRSPMIRPAATLFRVALTVFVITIVIGILNGLDVWDPGRDTLLTHVHAGTLGWITLAVIGASLLLFTDGQDPTPAERRGAQRLSILASVAIGLYVLAFWSGSGIQRPIAGTLVFVAVLWLYAWVLGRIRRGGLTIPRFAMAAALTSLVIGAVFGILLGLFLARGNVPGLADRIAGRLSDAHPGTMVIGYLLLAGTAIAEWLLRREHRPLSASRWGVVQVLAIFLAGAILIVGFLSENEDLAAVNLPLELLGVGIFLVRMWPDVRPRTWAAADAAGRFARWGVAWLIVNLGLLAYVVQLFLNDPNATRCSSA